MAEPSVLRVQRRLIPNSSMDLESPSCLECHSKNVIVEGFWKRKFFQKFQENEPVDVQMAEEVENQMTGVICPVCSIYFEILSDYDFAEKLELHRLKSEVAVQETEDDKRFIPPKVERLM